MSTLSMMQFSCRLPRPPALIRCELTTPSISRAPSHFAAGEELDFACWDKELRDAAYKHGFALIPQQL
jgi:hypothetical protein